MTYLTPTKSVQKSLLPTCSVILSSGCSLDLLTLEPLAPVPCMTVNAACPPLCKPKHRMMAILSLKYSRD